MPFDRGNDVIIDVHAHALDEAFLSDLQKHPIAGISAESDQKGGFYVKGAGWSRPSTLDPHLHDLPLRIASLQRRQVELQLFGPPPGFFSWVGGAAGRELVRALHEQEIAIAAQSEGLMEPMLVFAVGEPEKAVDEVRRAMDRYPFRAAMLASTAGGRPLDDAVFEPLWSLIEQLGLLVFLHPTSAVSSDRFGLYGVHVLVGWPFETTLAVTRLIFEGVLERHPGLKLILSHGGGNLVFLKGRLDSAYFATGWEANPYYRANISRPPSEFLHQLYYDTCALSPESNRFVIETMGAEHVMFGSDYPFDIGDPEGKRSVPVIESLAGDVREKIYRGNARALLRNDAENR
jgi:aminocarboxymuconate-semialdehyde decarboxylase